VTELEMLCNEVLMQFFEYLDGYHLFKTFYNLNSRFNRLLTDHQQHLKFNSKYVRENDIIDNKTWSIMVNYLTAITLIKDKHIRMLMSVCNEDDLICLKSLTLRRVRITKAKSAVVKFICNLKSLINLRVQALGEIFNLILMVICGNGLPELKSFECTSPDYETTVIFNWPMPTNIEYLTVECILYSFGNLLLQTPKLKYLNVNLTNYGPEESILIDSSLPIMNNLTYLKMEIRFVSYDDLSYIIKSMPQLQILELSGSSMGENLDNGQQLKQLFGHLSEVELDNLECLTSASSVDTILATFNDDIDGFWSNVTCSIKYGDRAYLSAFGFAR